MNKELREDLEHLIICKDKTITPDLRDDVKMTLDYIDELENKIDKALEILGNYTCYCVPDELSNRENEDLVYEAYMVLRGEENESN